MKRAKMYRLIGFPIFVESAYPHVILKVQCESCGCEWITNETGVQECPQCNLEYYIDVKEVI